MRTPSPRIATLGVVVVAAAACVGATLARPAPPAPPAGTVESVVRGSAVCPRPTSHGATTSALGLAIGDLPGVSGQARMSDLPTGDKTLMHLEQPGTRAAMTVPDSKNTVPAVLRVEGSAAPVTGAGLVTVTTEGSARGLSAVACAAPAGESWFVGGGGAVGRRSTVWLSNPDSTQAVVDLEVYGPDGPLAGHGSTGIVVPPHQQVGVRLDVVVPGSTRVALHVLARAGRVSAAVQDVDTRGLIPRGADYVPPAMAPARHVVVPAVLGGGTAASMLQVAVPGDADAIVNIKLAATDGTFTPEDANLLEIPAGSVASLNLAKALKDTDTVSVVIDSDVPVIAGVRTLMPRPGGSAETSYTSGTAPLTGPAVFSPIPASAVDVPALALAATDAEGRVEVTVLNPGASEPTTITVKIPAGTTVTRRLTELASGGAVVVAPASGSGPVAAALLMSRTDSDGILRTTVPLASNPSTHLVPAVVPDPATGVPD